MRTAKYTRTPSALYCANMSSPNRKIRGRRGNLHGSKRRTVAAPSLFECVAFSFGDSCRHGIIAPSVFTGVFRPQILTGSRAGGFRACRLRLRGISTPHGLPSPWKGSAVLKVATGKSAMSYVTGSSVSTAPLPAFLDPKRSYCAPIVPPPDRGFIGIADDIERIINACADRASFINRTMPEGYRKQIAFNVLQGFAAEVLEFFDDMERLANTAGHPEQVEHVQIVNAMGAL